MDWKVVWASACFSGGTLSIRERMVRSGLCESEGEERRRRGFRTRVVLEGRFAVGGLDLVGGRGAVEVEDLVGVDGRGFGVRDIFGRRHGDRGFW